MAIDESGFACNLANAALKKWKRIVSTGGVPWGIYRGVPEEGQQKIPFQYLNTVLKIF